MIKAQNFIFGLIITTVIVGCGMARVVTKYPNKGGVIAIPNSEDVKSREKAEKLMSANCGANGYEITEESEEVVGTTTSTESSLRSEPVKTQKNKFLGLKWESQSGGDKTSTSTSTHQEVEWRLKYKCRI